MEGPVCSVRFLVGLCVCVRVFTCVCVHVCVMGDRRIVRKVFIVGGSKLFLEIL